MLFPLPLYLIVFWLAWFTWRRHRKLDRKQALYDYIILIVTFAFFGFLTFGASAIIWDIVLAAGAAVSGFLVYLLWPSESARQAAIDGTLFLRQLRQGQDEGLRDVARDELAAELERERMKPLAKAQLYSISLAQEPEIIRMREIRVQVGTGKPRTEQAWFYVVSLGVPSGAEGVVEVQPMFKFPTTNDVYPLAFIPTTGKPWIHVTWPLPPQAPDFDEKRDFAKALVADKNLWIEKLNLEEGQPLVSFIFLFTVRGRDSVYFTSPNLIAVKMPATFRTALFLKAKDRPLVTAKVFEINARSWDSVSVNEVRDSL